MRNALVAFATLLLWQEDPEDLIKKLSDELIEVREKATADLMRLGERARSALEKSVGSSDGEVRTRAQQVLKALNFQRDLRRWLGPSSRISISGEMTMEEAIRRFERSSGQKISCDSWPTGTLRIDLKEVPFWEALESICSVSGARTPIATPSGPKLVGSKYIRLPYETRDAFSLRVESVAKIRQRSFRAARFPPLFVIRMVLAWERPNEPIRAFVEVEGAKDDEGTDHAAGFRDYEEKTRGSFFPVEQSRDLFSKAFSLTSYTLPLPTAKTIPVFQGKVRLWIRASLEDMELPVPPEGGSTTDSIVIADSTLAETSAVGVTVSEVARKEGRLTLGVTFKGIHPKKLDQNVGLVILKDGKGRQAEGRTSAHKSKFGEVTEFQIMVDFPEPPADSLPATVVVRLPRRLVELEIPFTLKDIPLN